MALEKAWKASTIGCQWRSAMHDITAHICRVNQFDDVLIGAISEPFKFDNAAGLRVQKASEGQILRRPCIGSPPTTVEYSLECSSPHVTPAPVVPIDASSTSQGCGCSLGMYIYYPFPSHAPVRVESISLQLPSASKRLSFVTADKP